MTAAPLVAIGASSGGPAALAGILDALPADFPAPIVVVQHIDDAFAEGLARWLTGHCALRVRLARPADVPARGEVLIVGGHDHMTLARDGTLRVAAEPAGGAYRPSIDVFFTSVARFARVHAVGVLLTGMGRDGAAGLRAMRQSGAFTIVQDKATSAVYGMPKAAVELDAADRVLPLGEIAPCLVALMPTFSFRNRIRGHG